MSVAFDTLAAAQKLEEAGMERRQAAAVAETAATAAGANLDNLATKADLAVLESKIAALEARLTWRMIVLVLAVNAAGAGFIIAAVGWMLKGV